MKSFLALIITVFLLASGAAMAKEPPGCITAGNITTAYRDVRPGGTLYVQVRVNTPRCALDNAFGAGATTIFFVEPRPGFESTIGPLTFSDFEKRLSSLDAPRAHVVETTVEVKAGQVPSGAYDIPASLDYQAVDQQGNIVHQRLGFTIPVLVYDSLQPPSTKARHGFQETLKNTGEWILIILVWPVWVVTCLVRGGCSNC
jgi:hypothetical protein